MTWTPTDEQVEEAADAVHKDGLWDLHYWERVRLARAVLVAVGPMIAAQAWDEAVNAITYPAIDEGRSRMTLRLVLPLPENPYIEKEAG